LWSRSMGSLLVSYSFPSYVNGKVVNGDVDANEREGFHATTAQQYAEGFRKALTLSPEETMAMRQRARKSSERFTDATFDNKWLANAEKLVTLQIERASR
jgi:hypothetical protein